MMPFIEYCKIALEIIDNGDIFDSSKLSFEELESLLYTYKYGLR